MRAGVALGSNVGDRLAHLRAARKELAGLPGINSPLLSSSIFETDPVGCEAGAAKFFNAVVELDYEGDALCLLRGLKEIERQLGRPAEHARNQSRAIDLDLLYFGAENIDSGAIQVPHPRMTERRFVLAPLAEISPGLVLPAQEKPIAALLARLPDEPAVERMAGEW